MLDAISMTAPMVRFKPTTDAMTSCHPVLQTNDHSVWSQTGLNELAGPPSVIGLHHKKDDVERLADFSNLTEMQRRNSDIEGSRGQVYGDTAFTNGDDMVGPLLDEGHVKTGQSKVGSDRGALRACP
jgi:hypothetical protein